MVLRYAAWLWTIWSRTMRQRWTMFLFLGEFATIFENILGHESGTYRWDCLVKKTLRSKKFMSCRHRYLMSRLRLKVFYLWRQVLLTFILWWSNLERLFARLHRSSPFIRGLRCQAIRTEHVYNRKNPKSSLFCEMSMTAETKLMPAALRQGRL
jgi:hypothetical protein